MLSNETLIPIPLETPEEITPEFPLCIDSTMLAAFASCERKAQFAHILNRVPRGYTSTHLIAGGAYAAAHEAFRKNFYNGMSLRSALEAGTAALDAAYGDHEPPDYPPSAAAKTHANVLRSFLAYYDRWPPATDPWRPLITHADCGPAVEFSFAEPFADLLTHPATGDPLLVGGKMDGFMVARGDENLANPPVWIYDDKTTYQMGAAWAKQWTLRGQFLCYMWGARQLGYNVMGYIIRGAAIQVRETKFLETSGGAEQWKLDEWYLTTYETIHRMLTCWGLNKWLKTGVHSHECSAYGGCPYQSLCTTQEPELWLPSETEHRRWSPIDVEHL